MADEQEESPVQIIVFATIVLELQASPAEQNTDSHPSIFELWHCKYVEQVAEVLPVRTPLIVHAAVTGLTRTQRQLLMMTQVMEHLESLIVLNDELLAVRQIENASSWRGRITNYGN